MISESRHDGFAPLLHQPLRLLPLCIPRRPLRMQT